MSDPNDKRVSESVSRADELIDEARLEAQLSVSQSTLQSWRYGRQVGPLPCRRCRCVPASPDARRIESRAIDEGSQERTMRLGLRRVVARQPPLADVLPGTQTLGLNQGVTVAALPYAAAPGSRSKRRR